jgi:hypothetical protein
MGHLIGSNRAYIEEIIPHIGSLLSNSLEDVITGAEVVVIATRGLKKEQLQPLLKPQQIIIDMVNSERGSRPNTSATYEGICW